MIQAAGYQTDLRACLLDLLNFSAEQVEEAKRNPADQYVAVDAARGVIPLMRNRLAEDNHLTAIFMLTFDQQLDGPWWRYWWENFAKLPPEEFSREADKLLSPVGSIAVLKQSLSQPRSE